MIRDLLVLRESTVTPDAAIVLADRRSPLEVDVGTILGLASGTKLITSP